MSRWMEKMTNPSQIVEVGDVQDANVMIIDDAHFGDSRLLRFFCR